MATRLNASEAAVIAVTILRIRPILFLRFEFAIDKSCDGLCIRFKVLSPGFLSPSLQSYYGFCAASAPGGNSPKTEPGSDPRKRNGRRPVGRAAWTVLYHAQFSPANQPTAIPAPRLPLRRTNVLICRISAAPPARRRTRPSGQPARRASPG